MIVRALNFVRKHINILFGDAPMKLHKEPVESPPVSYSRLQIHSCDLYMPVQDQFEIMGQDDGVVIGIRGGLPALFGEKPSISLTFLQWCDGGAIFDRRLHLYDLAMVLLKALVVFLILFGVLAGVLALLKLAIPGFGADIAPVKDLIFMLGCGVIGPVLVGGFARIIRMISWGSRKPLYRFADKIVVAKSEG
jgi:hypothetical protein